MHSLPSRLPRALSWLGALLLFWLAGAVAAQEADPPARAAVVTERQGSVVFAPQGEEEWVDLPANRPMTHGDRLWTDQDARAELQMGTATMHVDSETHLGISELDERAAQFMLQQGTVNARVREVQAGENFEVGTPNVAVRALQAGDFRVEVDAQAGQTRVVVNSGVVAVFGEGGQSIHLGTNQQAVFAGRFLAQVSAPPYTRDAFARWAERRNQQEDQAIATRYVPRGVVGASQLDGYGTWQQDASYGAVWYPTVTVTNWAPYRYGHWSWVAPWGWTWVDDAPWGFAPFHYGRWTMIGTRWAWVPGAMPARPVYSPALVVFLGGGSGYFGFSSGGPAVGWYPLAPGEAWYPWYRTSTRYVGHANYRINLNAWTRDNHNHMWRQRPYGMTAVREDDFRRGRAVDRAWQPVQPNMVGGARVGVVPARPEGRHWREAGSTAPRLQGTPPATAFPQRGLWGVGTGSNVPPAVRDQFRAQREQDRLQRDAEREAARQIRNQHDPRWQAIEQQRQQRDAGSVTTFEQQRNAGRVTTFEQQRNAGSAPYQPEPQGGMRRQHDRGGERWHGRPTEQPRTIRQPEPVQVQRQQATPVMREERGPRGGDEGGRGRGHGWGHRQ